MKVYTNVPAVRKLKQQTQLNTLLNRNFVRLISISYVTTQPRTASRMSQADQAVSVKNFHCHWHNLRTKLIQLFPDGFSKNMTSLLQGRAPSDANLASLDASRAQRELISQLEAKNKEIIREIARLRYTCVVYFLYIKPKPRDHPVEPS